MPKNTKNEIKGTSALMHYDVDNVQSLLNKNYNKSNDIIQHYRYNLPPYENKVLTYIVSHINWTDKDIGGITIDINEFHALCDLAPPSGGKDFSAFFDALEYLRTSKITVVDDSSIEWFSWLDKVSVNTKNLVYTVYLHEDVKPYFVDMQNVFARTGYGYTACSVSAVMRMKGLYSARLYELVKSYLNLGRWAVGVDELRKLLTPKDPAQSRNGKTKSRKGGRRSTNLEESYKEFKDFNKFVLKPAIEEINKLSDIYIDENFQKIRNHDKKIEKLVFTMHKKSDRDIRKIEDQVNKKVERSKIQKNRYIADDIKKQLLMSLGMADDNEFNETIVVNESLSDIETSKRYNLLKAVKLRLGRNFKDIFTGEYKDNYDDIFDVFIDMLWEDIKNNKEESLALVKFNEILNDSSVMEFIKKIILTYGSEAFWRNAERNGKQIKYRKKYLKVSMLNSLKDWQNFLSKIDNNPYTKEPEVSDEDDFIFNDMSKNPIFTI